MLKLLLHIVILKPVFNFSRLIFGMGIPLMNLADINFRFSFYEFSSRIFNFINLNTFLIPTKHISSPIFHRIRSNLLTVFKYMEGLQLAEFLLFVVLSIFTAFVRMRSNFTIISWFQHFFPILSNQSTSCRVFTLNQGT